ncbi:MAG: hypothetical protein P1S60_16135, partial [Anaerolineae bacterium]|nr:hypothetical protein [Anaerolineae bacterium]
VVIDVAEVPESRFDIPWNNQYITDRGDFAVTGRAWTADQNPEFPNAPTLHPINYIPQTGGGYYFVQWDAVTGALSYILQESADETFSTVDEFVLGSGTTSQLFTNQAPGTYYYRLKVLNALGTSFWSDVEWVTVPASNLALDIDQMVSPASASASYQPTVEVHIKKVGDPDNTWQAADVVLDTFGDWWNWTYNWTLPVETLAQQYVLQTRAKDLAGNYNPAMMDTVTVTVKNGLRFVYLPLVIRDVEDLHPYAPILNVDSDNGIGDYTLSWSYGYSFPTPTGYQFQEAKDSAFTNITIDGIRSSPQIFVDQLVGTYYYRVRGTNSYGPGPWSNTQMIVVEELGFYDDFSDPNSGWSRAVYDGVVDTNYENGSYRLKIMVDGSGANNYKIAIIPAPYVNTLSKYDIEVDHRFSKADDQGSYDPYGGKAGLIFGANADYSTIYVVEWNWHEGNCAVSKYWGTKTPYGDVRLDKWDSLWGWGSCPVDPGYDQTSHIKVEVNGNAATIKVDGTTIYSFVRDELNGMRNVALMTGSWQWTPVESRFDNFRVTPR